jgi:hypothetical protein
VNLTVKDSLEFHATWALIKAKNMGAVNTEIRVEFDEEEKCWEANVTGDVGDAADYSIYLSGKGSTILEAFRHMAITERQRQRMLDRMAAEVGLVRCGEGPPMCLDCGVSPGEQHTASCVVSNKNIGSARKKCDRCGREGVPLEFSLYDAGGGDIHEQQLCLKCGET